MLESLSKHFKDRTVLVTGHTGFKGSWLSLYLNFLGAKVIGYSLEPPTTPNLFHTARIHMYTDTVMGNILDLDTLLRVFSRYQPQIVFHLAAQPIVRRSYAQPLETLTTNIVGTAHVLEAVKRTPSVRTTIVVTSDKCYENNNWVYGYRETDPLGGHDPYSASKACAELVTRCYAQSYFSNSKTAVASVRAGNIIGGGDWGEDRLIPDCVRALTAHQPVRVRNPEAVRPWLSILDALTGYLFLAAKMDAHPADYAGPWNFGPKDEGVWSVRRVAHEVIRQWGEGTMEIEPHATLPEKPVLKLDSSKAQAFLGWRPRWNTQEAIARAIKWYKVYVHGAVMDKVCQNQIEEYLANE